MKPYICCFGAHGTAVIYGWMEAEPVAGAPARMYRARMVLYWSAECRGLLGLAAGGPKTDTRLTPAVESHGDECVRQWISVADDAAAAMDAWAP